MMTGEVGSLKVGAGQPVQNFSNLQNVLPQMQYCLPGSNQTLTVVKLPVEQLGPQLLSQLQKSFMSSPQVQAQLAQAYLAQEASRAGRAPLQINATTTVTNSQISPATPQQFNTQVTQKVQVGSSPMLSYLQNTKPSANLANVPKATPILVSQNSQVKVGPKFSVSAQSVQSFEQSQPSPTSQVSQIQRASTASVKRKALPTYRLSRTNQVKSGRVRQVVKGSSGLIRRPVQGCMGLVRTKKIGGIRPVKILRDFGGYWQVQYFRCTNTGGKVKPGTWEQLEWAPAWSEPQQGSASTAKQPIGAILKKTAVAHFFAELTPQQSIPLEILRRLRRLGLLS